MTHAAIVIAESGWITARVIGAWLAAGNTIAEIWCFRDKHPFLRRPRGLAGRLFPDWDAVRLVRRHKVPVRRCPDLKSWEGACARADALGAGVLMTLMTRVIVPTPLLAHFGEHAVNLHPAYLPHYKGPAPWLGMQLDGKADEAGGVTFHVLTPGIDEGPIIGQRAVPYSVAQDVHDWERQLARAAADIVHCELSDFLDDRRKARPQAAGSGNYRRIAPEELELTKALPAKRIKEMCDVAAPFGRLVWRSEKNGKPRLYRITGFDAEVGLSRGKPVRGSPFFVEDDSADARIRLHRRHVFWRMKRWISKVATLRRAELQ